LFGERFLKEWNARLEDLPLGGSFTGITRHEQHLEVGTQRSHVAGQVCP